MSPRRARSCYAACDAPRFPRWQDRRHTTHRGPLPAPCEKGPHDAHPRAGRGRRRHADALALTACGSDSLSEGGTSAAPPRRPRAHRPSTRPSWPKLPAKIKDAGTIVIGTDATYQPNEYLDADGKTVIGMDVDLFDAVMAKFGVKTQWVPSAFDAIILGVQSGKYDVGVSSFTVNAERLEQATMVSYFKAGTQWVTQKGNPKGVDPDDACGKTVGVQKGTVQADVDLPARNKACTDAGKPEIKVLVDADQAKVTASVQSGKADAMLVDLPPAIAAVDSTGGTLELLGEQYDSAPYGYVLPRRPPTSARPSSRPSSSSRPTGPTTRSSRSGRPRAGRSPTSP